MVWLGCLVRALVTTFWTRILAWTPKVNKDTYFSFRHGQCIQYQGVCVVLQHAGQEQTCLPEDMMVNQLEINIQTRNVLPISDGQTKMCCLQSVA